MFYKICLYVTELFISIFLNYLAEIAHELSHYFAYILFENGCNSVHLDYPWFLKRFIKLPNYSFRLCNLNIKFSSCQPKIIILQNKMSNKIKLLVILMGPFGGLLFLSILSYFTNIKMLNIFIIVDVMQNLYPADNSYRNNKFICNDGLRAANIYFPNFKGLGNDFEITVCCIVLYIIYLFLGILRS